MGLQGGLVDQARIDDLGAQSRDAALDLFDVVDAAEPGDDLLSLGGHFFLPDVKKDVFSGPGRDSPRVRDSTSLRHWSTPHDGCGETRSVNHRTNPQASHAVDLGPVPTECPGAGRSTADRGAAQGAARARKLTLLWW